MIRLVCWLVATALTVGGAARAADTHHEAARAFYEVVKVDDPQGIGVLVSRMLTALQPGLRRYEPDLAEFARELIASAEYADLRIRTYVEMFSEGELRALTRLFRDPVYRKYRERNLELVRRSAEHTMALFQRALPKLQRRMQARTPERE